MEKRACNKFGKTNYNALKKSCLVVLPIVERRISTIENYGFILKKAGVTNRKMVGQIKQLKNLAKSLELILSFEVQAGQFFKTCKTENTQP